MTEPIRSDFYRCGGWRLDPDPENRAYIQCGKIVPIGQECCATNDYQASRDPVTNRELLAHWLLADDDRRKEIEIASRPKEAGEYYRFVWDGKLTVHITDVSDLWIENGFNFDGLWEKL